LQAAAHTPPQAPVPPEIEKAERLLTMPCRNGGGAVARGGTQTIDIAYLGFHGQTILHRPSDRRTWQIGDGAALARATVSRGQ